MASAHSGGHEAKSPNCRKTRTYTEACAARAFRCIHPGSSSKLQRDRLLSPSKTQDASACNVKAVPASIRSHGGHPLIRCQEILDRMLPCKLLLDSCAPELTHPLALRRVIKQPKNFRCEIGHLIPGVAVQRCFPRTESPLFQIKLNNRLTQSHVFHDLNHCGDVVHLTRLIRVNTDIGSGKNLQQLPVGDPSRKVYELLEAFVLCHFSQCRQSRPPANTSEVNVATSRGLQVKRYVQKDLQTILNAHRTDITNKVRLAVLQSRIWGYGFESLQIRSIPDNENILGSKTPSTCSKISITVIGRYDDIAKPVRQSLKPKLGLVEQILLSVFRKVQLGVRIMMIEDVFDAKEFERQSNEENGVRRIAALNDMKSVPQIDPPCIEELQ